MPITIAPGYRKYSEDLARGELVLDGARCRRPLCGGAVVLTRSRVLRGAVLVEQDKFGCSVLRKIVALIALCRCELCGKRCRVLPSDIPAHKMFGLWAIECFLAIYATWERSLRKSVVSIRGDRTPAHTTLHGWTEGLGVHVLGRRVRGPTGTPFVRLQAESEKRVRRLKQVDRHPVVESERYRSEPRRERLQAMAFVLAAALVVTDVVIPGSLTEWRRLAVTWLTESALCFASKIRCTPFERVRCGDGQEGASGENGSAEECRIRPKSQLEDSS